MAVILSNKATVKLNRGSKITITPGPTGDKWYVSSTYNGTTQNGQINTPWKNISQVRSNIINSTVKPGDTVYFNRGDDFTGSFTATNINGQPGKPYIFSAYGSGNKPRFTGNNGAKLSGVFYLRGSSYFTFDNLEVIDPIMDPNNRAVTASIQYAFRAEETSGLPTTNINIQNCDVSLVGIAAVFNPRCDYNTFTSCNISNLRMVVNDTGTGKTDNDYGANGITIASSNNIITSNTFSDCWANSFDYTYDGGGVEFFEDGQTIENNLVAYNTFYNNNGTFEFGSGKGGTIQNNIIAYNKIVNCDGLFYINNGGTFAVNTSNNQFYNNVVLQTTQSRFGTPINMMSMRLYEATSNVITLKNNIFFATQTGSKVARADRFDNTNLIASNNVYTLQNGSVVNFVTGSTDYFSTGSFTPYWTNTTDPNPINWNYTPLIGSILIDSGVNVNQTRDFAGNIVSTPPERGILERT
jgi:hypothetical protein